MKLSQRPEEKTSFSALTPEGLLAGAYNLHVVNPTGEVAVLQNAFTIGSGGFSPAGAILLLSGP